MLTQEANIRWQEEGGKESYGFASSKKWLNLTFDLNTVISKQKPILCFLVNLSGLF